MLYEPLRKGAQMKIRKKSGILPRTPKTCFTLGLKLFEYILALKTTLKVSLNSYLSPFMLPILDNYDQK